jgi:hypothetical protein
MMELRALDIAIDGTGSTRRVIGRLYQYGFGVSQRG